MKKSQKQRVLEHLQSYGTITPREALDEYGISRLAGRIGELRKEYRIETIPTLIYNRYGDKTWCARYRLLADDEVAEVSRARL